MKHLIDKWTERWNELGASTTASIPEYDLVAEFIADLKKEDAQRSKKNQKFIIVTSDLPKEGKYLLSRINEWAEWTTNKKKAQKFNTKEEAEIMINQWSISYAKKYLTIESL